MVYSLFRVLVISSGFYFAFLKLIKNCIEIYSVLFTTILLFVLSCIRVFGETSSLMVYSLFRVLVISSGFYFSFLYLNKNCTEIPIILIYDYTTIRPFVYSCISVFAILFLLFSDYTTILLFDYTTIRLLNYFFSYYTTIRLYDYTIIRLFVLSIRN